MRSTKCHWCGEDYNDCNRCTHHGVYVEPERLALLERCAKDWAREQVDVDIYNYCQCCRMPIHANSDGLHAYNCDAAKFLKLEREAEK